MMMIRREIRLTAGLAAAITIVTFSHYSLQFIKNTYPEMVPLSYTIAFVLLGLSGYMFLRCHAQRSYSQSNRLTETSLFLTLTAWGLLCSMPSLYSPYNWGWSWSDETIHSEIGQMTSLILVLSGLAGLLFSFIWLGLQKSTGQNQSSLVKMGPYRFTRNPQIVTGALIPAGYFILRPSFYAAGWIVLLVFFAHLMIITEEEHLRNVFGMEYEDYCRKTPRYLGIFRRDSYR